MGRIMSLMMVAGLGLAPISVILGGFIAQVNLSLLLAGGGIGMAVLVVVSMLSVHIRRMGFEPALQTDSETTVVTLESSPTLA